MRIALPVVEGLACRIRLRSDRYPSVPPRVAAFRIASVQKIKSTRHRAAETRLVKRARFATTLGEAFTPSVDDVGPEVCAKTAFEKPTVAIEAA